MTTMSAAAFAYVGPGAGLGLIGSLFAVIAVFILALVGLVVFPLRVIMKRRRKSAAPVAAEERLKQVASEQKQTETATEEHANH